MDESGKLDRRKFPQYPENQEVQYHYNYDPFQQTHQASLVVEDKRVIQAAQITNNLVEVILRTNFAQDKELTDLVHMLINENLGASLFWTDESDKSDASTYCQELNKLTEQSGRSLRQYLIGRRLLNALITVSLNNELVDDLKCFLEQLVQMQQLKTEIRTNEFESVYIDPEGNSLEGISSATPKEAEPVVRGNLARGGLVPKPYFPEHANEHGSKAEIYNLGPMGYMKPTLHGDFDGFGSYDDIAVAVRKKDDPKFFIYMNYNYQTNMLRPLPEKIYQITYGERYCYQNYLTAAKKHCSRIMVQNEDSCLKPKCLRTSALHDLLGIGGLNIFSWPAMMESQVRNSAEKTKWSATVAK